MRIPMKRLLPLLFALVMGIPARGATPVAESMLDMLVSDLTATTLMDPRGVVLGEVEAIARHQFDGGLYVLVALDDEAGMDRMAAIPLSRVYPSGTRLITVAPTTLAALLASPFDQGAYVSIGEDQFLRDVAGVIGAELPQRLRRETVPEPDVLDPIVRDPSLPEP